MPNFTDPALSARIAAIEARFGDVRDWRSKAEKQLESLSERVTRAEEQIKHLPSKGFIVSAVTVGFGLLAAVVLFQTNLRSIIGR